ncbi:hypothetical protein WJX75_006252 [Coccomyxa subellipsoidea]|uniref:Chorismate lyase n=1 Tax=Coccomyxa subellipsoidea TaxID=248742 RepID=A0ABR2YMS9_9CHLO
MTGAKVETDCLEQEDIGMNLSGLPDNVASVAGPRSQRELHLSVEGTALVCATSWWNTDEIARYLGQTQKPIWINLSVNRTELYREITQVYCGHSPDLERRFGQKGPFWGREYIFWHDGKPLTLIHEIFSPALEDYLGPVDLKEWCMTNSSRACPT